MTRTWLLMVANVIITLFNLALVVRIVREVREVRRLERQADSYHRETQTLIAEMNEVSSRNRGG